MKITSIPRSFVMVSANNKLYPAVVTSYFAGDAWLVSDEAFEQICGSSFGVVIFEDNVEYRQHKSSIKKPTIQDWENLSNENKEVCYTRWGEPSKCIFYQ